MNRRTSDYNDVAYGFISGYEYQLWKHVLSDPAFNREREWPDDPSFFFGRERG